jgi:hypothetical protein
MTLSAIVLACLLEAASAPVGPQWVCHGGDGREEAALNEDEAYMFASILKIRGFDGIRNSPGEIVHFADGTPAVRLLRTPSGVEITSFFHGGNTRAKATIFVSSPNRASDSALHVDFEAFSMTGARLWHVVLDGKHGVADAAGCDSAGVEFLADHTLMLTCNWGNGVASSDNVDLAGHLLRSGKVLNGARVGLWYEFYWNGCRKAAYSYVNNSLDGAFMTWGLGDDAWVMGQYRDGVPAGRWSYTCGGTSKAIREFVPEPHAVPVATLDQCGPPLAPISTPPDPHAH